MMWYRIGNFILYPGLTTWFLLRFFETHNAGFLIPATVALAVFLYIYLRMFRRKGLDVFREMR